MKAMLRSVLTFAFGLPLAGLAAQIPVVGIPSNGDGRNPPPRRNIIDVFSEGGPEWSLLVQGLISLQDQPETEETSFFQIMGIHGVPHIGWNGVEQVAGGNSNMGFCPHNEVLFVSWHRPYLVLFEQTLHAHISRIASMYGGDDAAAYQAAAQRVRTPYWDWASDARLPDALSLQQITITTPQGQQTVRNPWYSYRFKRSAQEAGLPWDALSSRYGETKRGPLADGTEDYGALNVQLSSHASYLKTLVYNVFTQTKTFEQMATDQFSGSSFESPHNTVHNLAGGGGHLMYLDWSAFDPAFIVHHCNVDRLMALWQAINYLSPVFNITAHTNGRYGTAPGAVTADSPLKPFYASSAPDDFHTSRTVADVTRFGYSYPELLQGNVHLTPEELRSLVIQRVNVLYGPGGTPQQGASKTSLKRRSHARDVRKTHGHHDARHVVSGQEGGGGWWKGGKEWDYSVQVRVEREELDLPVVLEVYVCGKRAGEVTLLGMPRTGTSFSVVPLTQVLGELEGLGEELEDLGVGTVLPLLERDLRVDIHKYDGTSIPVSSVPSLQLEVQSREYTPAKSDAEFPAYGAVNKVTIPVVAGP